VGTHLQDCSSLGPVTWKSKAPFQLQAALIWLSDTVLRLGLDKKSQERCGKTERGEEVLQRVRAEIQEVMGLGDPCPCLRSLATLLRSQDAHSNT
jgi:hypothetical protein